MLALWDVHQFRFEVVPQYFLQSRGDLSHSRGVYSVSSFPSKETLHTRALLGRQGAPPAVFSVWELAVLTPSGHTRPTAPRPSKRPGPQWMGLHHKEESFPSNHGGEVCLPQGPHRQPLKGTRGLGASGRRTHSPDLAPERSRDDGFPAWPPMTGTLTRAGSKSWSGEA